MLRPLCACGAYGSGTDVHPEHAHHFPYFSNVHFLYPQHARKELMRALSMRVRNWCVHWAGASGTDAYAEHTSQELVRALSIRIRYLFVHRAHSLQKNAEHTHQELMHTLSIRVRNWCIRWAYESGTDLYPEHTHQFLMRMLSISIKILNLKEVPTNHAEHTRNELVRMLSIHVRNWYVCWAYALVPYAYAQHARQKLNVA